MSAPDVDSRLMRLTSRLSLLAVLVEEEGWDDADNEMRAAVQDMLAAVTKAATKDLVAVYKLLPAKMMCYAGEGFDEWLTKQCHTRATQ